MQTREWGYWGSDLSGTHLENTVLTVTPSGKVTEAGKSQDSFLYGPRDDATLANREKVLLSLGHFFSRQLDKITKVDKSTDGRIVVSALGRRSKTVSGRWELEIEPDAAWMVRKARFYGRLEPDSLTFEMRNEGARVERPLLHS